ncbi:DUF6053 domain-containing protein [Lysobacter enzymogenes]
MGGPSGPMPSAAVAAIRHRGPSAIARPRPAQRSLSNRAPHRTKPAPAPR